jgi:plasmid stability protein
VVKCYHMWRRVALTTRPSSQAHLPRYLEACNDIMISGGQDVAQFVVRHLEDELKARLRRRAARHGHSMEEEAREILRDALKNERTTMPLLGSRVAARFARCGLADDLPELHGQVARPARFA